VREILAENNGRPSLTSEIYFRLLMVGYYEGIDSERGIAWRADSIGPRKFLGVGLDEQTPDRSTISRTRRRIDVEAHRKIFFWDYSARANAARSGTGPLSFRQRF
jgi:transposase